MFSVLHEGKVLDIVCRIHEGVKDDDIFRNWYTVYLGERYLGQVILMCGAWDVICDVNPEYNWLGKGFSTRRLGIEFMLRASGYWKKS